MGRAETIRGFLALAAPALPDPGKSARVGARVIWVRETMAALRAAQKRADDALLALVADLPDDEDELADEELPEPPEQAEVDALWEMMNAVVEKDRWPRDLYFGYV